MKSKNFDKVKYYYDEGYWNIDRVHRAVGLWITVEEYTEITGFIYPNKTAVEQTKTAEPTPTA